MKHCWIKTTLLAALITVASPFTWAAPLQRSQVAGDAVWFAHVDVDQFKQTKLGQHFLAELGKPEAESKLAALTAVLNFDPRKALHGCTLYSRGATPQDAVLLAFGEFDAERLATLVKANKDYESSKHRSHTVHSWLDEKKPAQPRTYGAIHKSGIVILGQKSERIGEALDVVDGVKPSLEKSQSFSGAGSSVKSAFLLAAARKTDFLENNPQAALLKHLSNLTLTASESEGQLSTDLAAQVDSEETSQHVASIGQGLISLLALQSENPTAQKLARGVAVKQDGTRVVASVKIATAELIQFLKDEEAKKKKPAKP